MHIKALSAAWETDIGELSFKLSDDGEHASLVLPDHKPIEMPVGDWRMFGQFLTRSLMASSLSASKPNTSKLTDVLRSGAARDDVEDERLVKEFRQGVDFQKIADIHKRTRGAITSRLEQKGLLPPYGQHSGADSQPVV